jgi:phosphatidylglycerophosphatase A
MVKALATGLFVGQSPFMPGTWGTLFALPLAWLLMTATAGRPVIYMILVVAFVFFAAWISDLYERSTSQHDPSEIVIDEFAGLLVTMTWLPLTWQSFAAGFVVFRFFDILKPFPIGRIDRKIGGGFGTVLDDVAAGLAANVVLQIVFTHTDWLGVQFHGAI